ncbi:MAG: hypothetical protein KZQ93_15870 [Candidatus Thiodiazotropha sp. (ex Monitilora ramsayi)]|nr:hypothetical protein [Candidatus Thiodiazotropha sp. (ex Monitilora ramsayi)]
MADTLKLTGRVMATKNKQPVALGPGTKVKEIELPDKTYGLKDEDIDRIVKAGAGVIIKPEPEEAEEGGGQAD